MPNETLGLGIWSLGFGTSRVTTREDLGQRSISSQLVDNLNASMHIRALLTDIFLIDEVLKSQTTESPQTSKP